MQRQKQFRRSHAVLLASTAAGAAGKHCSRWAAASLRWRGLQDPSGEAASQAQKHLTYYELDLGLNHVLRKWSEPIDNGGNLLVAVPGGGDGPGGVLVAADNFVIYRDQEHEEVPRCPARPDSLLHLRATARQPSALWFSCLELSELGLHCRHQEDARGSLRNCMRLCQCLHGCGAHRSER